MDRSRSGAEETDISITPPKSWAVGVPAMAKALRYSLEQRTVRRTGLTLLNLNQTKGFVCPGCAWPEPYPAHRHRNEYCENGAKHVSDEATSRRITAGFFREHPVPEPPNDPPSGSTSRAGSPSRWSSGPARTTTNPSAGTRPSHSWPGNWLSWTPRRGRLLHIGPRQQRGRHPPPRRHRHGPAVRWPMKGPRGPGPRGPRRGVTDDRLLGGRTEHPLLGASAALSIPGISARKVRLITKA